MKNLGQVEGRPVYGIEHKHEAMKILKKDPTSSLVESHINRGYTIAVSDATYIVPEAIAKALIADKALMLRYVVYGCTPMAVVVGDIIGKKT
jgi:hypothetical protein